MDAVARDVKRQIGERVAHAYGFAAATLPPFDPELCTSCQNDRPSANSTICASCATGGATP